MDDLDLIFPGDSEMAGRMRSFDWSNTPVGLPGTWSAALRTGLGICLTSQWPMYVWWGPVFTFFYNDGCIPLLGAGKHPAALGRDGRDAWPEIWEATCASVGPVLEGRAGAWSKHLSVTADRCGRGAEVDATLSCSPLLGDGTAVDGVLCACFSREIAGTALPRRRSILWSPGSPLFRKRSAGGSRGTSTIRRASRSPPSAFQARQG